MFNCGRSEKAVVATIVATSATVAITATAAAATAATAAAVRIRTYACTHQTIAASALIIAFTL